MFLALVLLAAIQQPQSLYEAMGLKEPGLRGAELDAAVAAAAPYPLGSKENPVRARWVDGEYDYLKRLRCANGKPPQVLGRSTGSLSPFGGISDNFSLQCVRSAPASSIVTIDMYHQHRETRPVPGFTLKR